MAKTTDAQRLPPTRVCAQIERVGDEWEWTCQAGHEGTGYEDESSACAAADDHEWECWQRCACIYDPCACGSCKHPKVLNGLGWTQCKTCHAVTWHPATKGSEETHDESCESEFIEGPNAYSPCRCAERAKGSHVETCGGTYGGECDRCPTDKGSP